jgi:hypothetical protein
MCSTKDLTTGVLIPRYTHVCNKYWRVLKLSYNTSGGRWLTSLGNVHVAKWHPESQRAQDMQDHQVEKIMRVRSMMEAAGEIICQTCIRFNSVLGECP